MVHIENIDGEVVFLAHRDGSYIHHAQTSAKHFIIRDFLKFFCTWVFLRISRIDAIYARPLQHYVGFYFYSAQRRARISGKIRIARPRRHNHDLAAFQSLASFPFTIKFADRLHTNGGQNAGFNADSTKCTTQSQTIDHRSAHSHLITFDPVKTFARSAESAKDVAATNYDADLHTEVANLLNLRRIFV